MTSIRSNARLLLAGRVVGLAAALTFDVVLSRTLGREMRGLYAVIVSSATLVSTAFGLSLQTSLSWAAATGRARGATLAGLSLTALGLGAVLSLSAYAVLFVVAPNFMWKYVFSSRKGPDVALLSVFLVPCVLADAYGQAALNGAGRVATMTLQQVTYALWRVGLALLLFVVLGMSIEGLMLLVVLVGLEQIIVSQGLLWRRMGGVTCKGVGALLRTCLPYALKRHVGTVAMVLSGRLAVLIVNAVAGLAATGVYAVAAALAETAALLNTVVFQASLHRIGSADEQTARALTERGARMSVLLMSLVSLVAVPAVWFLVPLMWGEGFRQVGELFAILMAGYVLMGTNPIVIYFGVHRDQPVVATLFAVAGPVVGLPAFYFLAANFGAIGAASAAALSYATIAAAMVSWYRLKTGTPVHRVLVPSPQDVGILVEEVRKTLTGLVRR